MTKYFVCLDPLTINACIFGTKTMPLSSIVFIACESCVLHSVLTEPAFSNGKIVSNFVPSLEPTSFEIIVCF